MDSFCNSVVTIPQYEGTCWFNTLLMMIFYSQYSRKLLLHKKPFNKKKEDIMIIFKAMLYRKYIRNKDILKYFNFFSPTYILKKLKLDSNLLNIILLKGYTVALFISYFLDFINMNYIILDSYKSNIYVGITENITISMIDNKIFFKSKDNNTMLSYYESFKKTLNDKIPDYIIVNIYDDYNCDYFINKLKYLQLHYDYKDKILFNNYNYNIKDLSKFKNEIFFKGNKYILDSCSLSNFNSKKYGQGHAIAGITCKDKRFVYNGWFRLSDDPAMKQLIINKNELPCELMVFNWDLHNKHSHFCLNRTICKLDNIIINNDILKKDLCFSFNKGLKTILYVRTDSTYNSLDFNISSSLSSISSISSDKIKKDDIKICPPGKILNPKTNRCIKIKPDKIKTNDIKIKTNDIKNKKDDIKICPPGKILNPMTNRCIKIKTNDIKIKKDDIKKCPPGKILNPKTNRCIKIKPDKI